MWLLMKYYSAYVILRQRFLTSGEASVNEWQEQYMQSSLDKKGKEEGKGVLAALKHFKQLFDPSEVCYVGELEMLSTSTLTATITAFVVMNTSSNSSNGNHDSSVFKQ